MPRWLPLVSHMPSRDISDTKVFNNWRPDRASKQSCDYEVVVLPAGSGILNRVENTQSSLRTLVKMSPQPQLGMQFGFIRPAMCITLHMVMVQYLLTNADHFPMWPIFIRVNMFWLNITMECPKAEMKALAAYLPDLSNARGCTPEDDLSEADFASAKYGLWRKWISTKYDCFSASHTKLDWERDIFSLAKKFKLEIKSPEPLESPRFFLFEDKKLQLEARLTSSPADSCSEETLDDNLVFFPYLEAPCFARLVDCISRGPYLAALGSSLHISLEIESLVYDGWACTPNSSIVLAANTKEVPDIPHWNSNLSVTGVPCLDGRWGLSEYSTVPQLFDPEFPYLAWMPTQRFARLGLPTMINTFRVIEDVTAPNSVFVRNSGWQHRGHLRTEIWEKLQEDVVHYIESAGRIIRNEADPSLRVGSPEARPPVIALVRAHNSAFCMRFAYLTLRDLAEYIAGLQRSVAELQAYTMWYDHMHYSDLPSSNRSFELGLRGSIARTVEEYNLLRRLGAPVWLEIEESQESLLDPKKKTRVTLLRVETRIWEEMPVSHFLRNSTQGCLVHNKPLEYYPPSVVDASKYERAARGYWPREDKLRRDLRCRDDVLSMLKNTTFSGENHNQSTGLASRSSQFMEAADRAIAPTPEARPSETKRPTEQRSKWLRQFLDTKQHYTAIAWAPKSFEAWDVTRHNSDYYPLVHNIELQPKCSTLLLYVAPPRHLFLGIQKPEKLADSLFIWMCIRRPWLSRIGTDLSDPISWGITTQKWRDVLSGQYWKHRHPCNAEPGFELHKFWRNGGPLILEDDEAMAAEDDISPEFPDSLTGRLEPRHLDHDDVKALILWDFALCYTQLQLDRADEILYAARQQDGVDLSIRRARRARRSDVFHDPKWHRRIPRELPPWEKPLSDPSRHHWLSCLLEVVRY
ncbi:hypothetical protein C8R45DRAFT_939653 [Mycena sanguinolenta]|nr:hypothetical protein C8R45DRAFT_939653 [Mycena sanguinolenta]